MVRAVRDDRQISAQQLSDLCTDIGYAIPRNTIANLENGRKDLVSIQELAVIARALNFPAISLMYPTGSDEFLEVLPAVRRLALEGVEWFSGKWALVPAPGIVGFDGSYYAWSTSTNDESRKYHSAAGPLHLVRAHQQMVEELVEAIDIWSTAEAMLESHADRPLDDAELQMWRVRRVEARNLHNNCEANLRRVREDILDNGYSPRGFTVRLHV